MPQWLTEVIEFATSIYLAQFWWLICGYAVCYGMVLGLSRVRSKANQTILYNCRRAWSIAFALHAVASLGVMVYWYTENGMFNRFWHFFPLYVVVLFIDFLFAIGLFASRHRYANYHE